MYDILLTCPPMIGMVNEFAQEFRRVGFNVHIPDMTQEVSETDLITIVHDYDGWIVGDDPVTKQVLEAGVKGKLKACMRWGVGINNVDFEAAALLGVPIENTPGVFGREVADLACHYVTGLARHTFEIDRNVRVGKWSKPPGHSLWSARALIVGLGDIGCNIAKRLHAHEVQLSYYDPYVRKPELGFDIKKVDWPMGLAEADYVIFTAPLTPKTYHMFDGAALAKAQNGLRLINVGRGSLVCQETLVMGLRQGVIASAALDVFEQEPYDPAINRDLQEFEDRLIFGSHNGSNTREAVIHVSQLVIERLSQFLNGTT